MKVILSPIVRQKLKYYIDNIDAEISGFGVVERVGKDLFVPEIFTFKQHCSETSTELDTVEVANFYTQMFNDGFPVEKLKLWWHSHVNMNVYWSEVDKTFINRRDNEQKFENWWLSVEGNKRGELIARLDVYEPHRMTVDKLEIVVGDPALEEEIKKEIEEKVTVRQVKQNYYGGGNYYPNYGGQFRQNIPVHTPQGDTSKPIGIVGPDGNPIRSTKNESNTDSIPDSVKQEAKEIADEITGNSGKKKVKHNKKNKHNRHNNKKSRRR